MPSPPTAAKGPPVEARSSTTAFAKSTLPELSGAVLRQDLFRRLDGGTARTVAWISAPPGFGKTTLVASYVQARNYRWAWYQVDRDDDDGETFLHYLSHAMKRLRGDAPPLPVFGPEHHADPSAFARRFFRALFAGVEGPVALVLDNVHELAADSPLRTILEVGLPLVPRQCCVLVTSRAPAPVALARLQPDGQMVCLNAEDLRIAPTELAEMASLRGLTLDEQAALQLNERAEGWPAALVLMIEHLKLAGARTQAQTETTPTAVFDYLAGEIFERFDSSTQRVLLQMACVPRITVEIAQRLSGDDSAARVLFNLAHNDYFVRELVGAEGRVFQFHPLLREFLLRRAAREWPQAVSAQALRRAALMLRESGQLEDAVALLVQTKNWPDIAGLAAEQAGSLLAQGRHATLARWLECLPPHVLVDDPVLLRAHGAALLPSSPRQARRRFEKAFDVFRSRSDTAGMVMACTGVIEAVLSEFDDLAELDRWLEEFDRCRNQSPDLTTLPLPVQVARLWREPSHPSISRGWPARAHDSDAGASLARATAAAMRGDMARASAALADLGPGTGALRPAVAVVHALRHWLSGEHAEAFATARAGLDRAAEEAAHGHDVNLHLLCAAAALGRDDTDAAAAELGALGKLPLRRGERACLQLVRGWHARACGDAGVALRETKAAVSLAEESGMPWLEGLARLEVAQLLAMANERAGAEAQHRVAEALAQRLGSPLLQMALLLTQAAAALTGNDEPQAAVPLQMGLEMARELGLHHVVGMPPALMGQLCATALRRGIAVEQTRMMVTLGGLAPPPAAFRLRRWPWRFEVTTLGRFGLQRGGEPVEFSAKGPGRPVELLKVLLSQGGQNVRAEHLADALWPHVDADYAHKSFTATLHRLRRIFGAEDTLKLSDGRLSLNSSMFWVDTWALDHLLAELDARLRDPDVRAADQTLNALVDETLALYRGPFLPDEAEQPAYIARREQLRARLLHATTRVARRWEESGRRDAAVDCYLRCIDADELCEAFYRNLMLCHQRHSEVAEALAVFERLQAVLAARLRGEPSPETRAIHAGLRG